MSRCLSNLLLMLLVCAGPGCRAESGDERSEAVPAKDPKALLKLLDKGDFDERQDAEEFLKALGERARPVVENALTSKLGLETKAAARRILDFLNRATVVFHIKDENGLPLPNRKVGFVEGGAEDGRMADQKPLEPVWRTTDPKGRAQVTGVPVGESMYQVWLPEKSDPLAVPPPEHRNYRSATFQSGVNHILVNHSAKSSISGTLQVGNSVCTDGSIMLIEDEGQYAAAEEAARMLPWFHIYNENEFLPWARADTDGKGLFTLKDVPPGKYLLFARQKDAPWYLLANVITKPGEVARLALPGLRAKAETHGRLALTVLDGSGKAMSEVDVYVEAKRLPEPGEEKAFREDLESCLDNSYEWSDTYTIPKYKTDKKGLLNMDALLAGTYYITLRMVGRSLGALNKIVIAPGKTAAATCAIPEAKKGGHMEGLIVDGKGVMLDGLEVWAFPHAHPEALALLAHPDLLWEWMQIYEPESEDGHWHRACKPFHADVENGRYRFAHLPGGTYSLVLKGEEKLLVYRHGVQVEAGATAKVERITLNRKQEPQGAAVHVRGVVYLSDGRPADEVSYVFYSENSGIGSETDEDGVFEHDTFEDFGKVTRVEFERSGYRPLRIDLTKKGLNLENLVVRLVKQHYGSAKILVVDAEDRPVVGAEVSMGSYGGRSRNHFFNGERSEAIEKRTNKAGVTLIKGLAVGRREVIVSAPELYVVEDASFMVEAGKQAQVKVVMHPVVAIQGRVEFPEGRSLDGFLISCIIESSHANGGLDHALAVVDAKGRFRFSGLAPGTFDFGPAITGWCSQRRVRIAFKHGERPPSPVVKAIRSAGLKIDMGPAYRGTEVSLASGDSWHPFKVQEAMKKKASSGKKIKEENDDDGYHFTLDSNGRGETFGPRPGKRTVLLEKNESKARWDSESHPTGGTLTLAMPEVELLASKGGRKEWLERPYRTLEVPKGTGRVRFVVAIDAPEKTAAGSLAVLLVSQNAKIVTENISLDQIHKSNQAPQILGSPPAGAELERTSTFAFEFKGLPKGTYQVGFEYYFYLDEELIKKSKDKDLRAMLETHHAAQLTTAHKPIEIENGKLTDLGTLTFTCPAEAIKAKQKLEALRVQFGNEEVGEDLPQDDDVTR